MSKKLGQPLVSVIIPTFNSEVTIGKCINSVKNQTYNNIEIIVVDGLSNDNTVELAKKAGANVYTSEYPSRTFQTNIGVKKSSSESKYIYRLDSDIVISKSLISECVSNCEKKYDAVATYWAPDSSISFWASVRKLEKDCYKYDPLRNVARFFKKDLYIDIGGYDENLNACEDYDIQNSFINNGFKIGFIESEGIHLGEPKTLKDIIRKNYQCGKTDINFLSKNYLLGIKQINPIRKPILKNWRKFLKHPLLTIGFIFYFSLIYFIHLFSFIISLFEKKFKSGVDNIDGVYQ